MPNLERLAQPNYFTHPNWDVTFGPEVGEVAALAGLPPYPEQQLLLDELFALDPTDSNRSASFEEAVICARQQLKTGLLKQAALGWLFVMPQPLVIWSAHEFATAQEAFTDIQALISSSPDLDAQVAKMPTAAGSEAVILRDGSRLKFKARTGGGGRGLTGSKVILDEAFALEPAHMGALLPTLISVPDPQVLYASSAGMAKSAVLRGVRDRGRSGVHGLTYAEWGSDRIPCKDRPCDHMPGHPGCALDNMALWRQACPITARRDPEAMLAIANLRKSLPPEEFMRECLGWWDDPLGDSPITAAIWADERDPDSNIVTNPKFALDVSPDQAWSCIAVAGRNQRGKMHVEITSRDEAFDYRPATDWVVPRLTEIMRAQGGFMDITIAAGGAAESLVPDLERAGLYVERVRSGDVMAACGHLYNLAMQNDVAHLGQVELTTSVTGARQRWVAERAFVWVRSGSVADVTPLYAITYAAWASDSEIDVASNVW